MRMSPACPAQAQVQPSSVPKTQFFAKIQFAKEKTHRKQARDIKFPTNVGTCHLDPLGLGHGLQPGLLDAVRERRRNVRGDAKRSFCV